MDLSLSLYLIETARAGFDRERLAAVIRTLGSHGLLAAQLALSVDWGKSSEVVGSADELAALALQWPDHAHVLMTTPAKDYEATFVLEGARGAIELFFFAAFIARRADRLLAEVAAALRASLTDAEDWRVERASGLSVRNFDYPRLRPARVPLVVGRPRLTDVVDLRVAASPEDQRALAAIRDAALPEGARREVIGSRVLVEWAADCTLASVDALRQRLAAREQWLIREAGAVPERDWNAAGDVKHGFLGGEPHPPLTLYNRLLGIGYKAIHGATPPAEIDATLREVGRWIAEGRVDEETEVSDVVIIADSRSSALALRPRMDEAGVHHVVYPDDQRQLWDPFPDGLWIEDP
jgi:hypothetical protein